MEAKSLNPRIKVVLRIFDEDIAELATKAGIADEVLSTTKVAVKNYIIRAYLNIEPFKLTPVTVEVSKESPLKGMKVHEVESSGVKILVIVRGDEYIRPSPNDEILEGDYIMLLGDAKSFGKLLKIFVILLIQLICIWNSNLILFCGCCKQLTYIIPYY